MAFRTNKTPVLQEKTASGSVASFNTILQKPLVNGEFTIQAYQEGTGDPSPDNVRNIVGYSELNMYKRGVNLWDEQWERGMLDDVTGINKSSTNRIRTKNYIPIQANTTYYIDSASFYFFIFLFDKDKNLITDVGDDNTNYIRVNNITFETPNNAKYLRFYSASLYGGTYNNNISINYPSTDTDYHAYNGAQDTKQLGETVYGGSYNSVSGEKNVNSAYETIDDASTIYLHQTVPHIFGYRTPNARPATNQLKLCNSYKVTTYKMSTEQANLTIDSFNGTFAGISGTYVKWRDDRFSTVEEMKEELSNNPLTIVYDLNKPIESNIGATEIQTFDGVNNIFCDTGDTSVVFNDLDIAKRGSFREVFKLP